jgi:hypothetical protein
MWVVVARTLSKSVELRRSQTRILDLAHNRPVTDVEKSIDLSRSCIQFATRYWIVLPPGGSISLADLSQHPFLNVCVTSFTDTRHTNFPCVDLILSIP